MKRIGITSLVYGIILIFLFYLALFIRGVISYNGIFTSSFVRFGGYDVWYNMRLVENTLHHFPYRITFDPYTYYPHGTTVGFAPLFDQLLAFIIWVIGLGNPVSTLGQHGIEVIAAWYPAVLGALTVIPVYFIGKELYNRNVGLFSAALIAVLPGQFLTRSLLGFTDHHVAETLFSTIAMLFLILAIKSAKENEITFYSIQRKDWNSLRKPMLYSISCGIFLGCYFLSWVGAPLFIFILLIYAVVQYVVDHLRGESTDYLCIVIVPVFLVSLAMILPVLHPSAFAEFQALSLFLGIAVFLILSGVSFSMNRKKIVYGYPIAILTIGIISFVLLSFLNPSLYTTLTGHLIYIFTPSESFLTISEVNPMHFFSQHTGRFADGDVWQWFTTTFFLAFVALAWIGYNIARKFRPEEILFIVWSAIMLFACFGQSRFAAYYAVNVAILCGFVLWKGIDIVESRKGGIKEVSERGKKKVKGKKKKGGAGGVKTEKAKLKAELIHKEVLGEIKMYLRADIIITFIVILLVVFYPPLNVSIATARQSTGPDYNWYESLSWLRGNTTDPGVDYYALYDAPPEGEDYNYPESAYSVISWWDYGHWITRIAHRIPVANNFQQGIGGPYQGNSPGACVFFTARTETEANKVADALDVRYVVTDFMMVDAMGSYSNKYWAMTFWAGNTSGHCDEYRTESGVTFELREKYFNTIATRLHMFDGSEVESEGEYIGQTSILSIKPFHAKTLQHYRLVHESPTYMIPHVVLNATTEDMLRWECSKGNYTGAKEIAQKFHQGFQDRENQALVNGTPQFFSPVSFVKVFEYVKGARIEGRVPDASIVEIATNITTNQGREFIYSQRAISNSNGSYVFIVPYSTEGPIEGSTNFDVLASPYKIRAGHLENETIVWDIEREVEVNEKEVVEGRTISVEFLFPE